MEVLKPLSELQQNVFAFSFQLQGCCFVWDSGVLHRMFVYYEHVYYGSVQGPAKHGGPVDLPTEQTQSSRWSLPFLYLV